jgi:hypothetical protein
MHKFLMIPTHLVEILFDKIEPHLQRVVDASNGEITCESVKEKALRGDCGFILVSKGPEVIAVNTIEVCQYDSGLRVLLIPVVGGTEAFDWGPDFLSFCREIAKSLGCTEMRGFSSRQAWLKVLRDYGWYESHFVIKCDVED